MPPIVTSPEYEAPLPEGHRFPMGKFRALAELLLEEGLAPDGFHIPQPADADVLSRAHDPTYVAQILNQSVPPALERRIGLPVSAGVVRRACAAVGGTLLTARLALTHGVACNTAGGSHHASYAGGAGFCVFNDVAVASLQLLAEGAVQRILVLDLDVHQGDGTAEIFAYDSRVITVSVHCAANYPARKSQSDIDIGLEAGAGDAEYLRTIEQLLPRTMEAAAPDLVFFNAGVDVHREDRLGKLALTDRGLDERDRMVLDYFAGRAPLAGVIGGGYGPNVNALARRHAGLHRNAALVAQNQSNAVLNRGQLA